MNGLSGEREALSGLDTSNFPSAPETFIYLLETEPFDRNGLTSQSDELEAILHGDVDILELDLEWSNGCIYHVARSNFNQREISRAAIFNAVDVSLERSASISFKITVTTAICPAEETIEALYDLVQVRYTGARLMGGMVVCPLGRR
ncbi:hypothetical protein PQX77_005390 [Marasmius sp. AFHP31]|nr:hypothetical protein PQX77_005390 [Marasmius sp. AFHP31]